jgi:hypothetical protein
MNFHRILDNDWSTSRNPHNHSLAGINFTTSLQHSSPLNASLRLYFAMRNLVVLGGSSHPSLTKSICNRLGVPEGKIVLGKFSNGETSIQIQESVRGKDVFIITTGCGEINEILMELFIMLSACKTASARRNIPGPCFSWSSFSRCGAFEGSFASRVNVGV